MSTERDEVRQFTTQEVARFFDVPVWTVDPSLPVPRWYRFRAFLHRLRHGFYGP